jgi:chitodextrinase
MTSHTIEGLKPGRTYTFRAYAKDAAGNTSKASNAVTVTLPGQLAAPSKPAVHVLGVGPTHVTLSWVSTDDGPIIWYTIYIDGEPVSTLNSRTATFTCARVMVPTYCDPLNQDTTYAFTIRARDVDGNLSPVSDPVFVTTRPIDPHDQTPPTRPANVTAESNGAFVNVRWNASTDDLAPQSLIRYDIYVNGELSRVVVGETAAEVEVYFGVNEIAVIAVDTADHESEPGTTTIIH